jgi:hypothetical protein
MSITKRMLLASGATLALSSAVRGQGPPQGSNQEADVLLDHQAYHFMPEGRMRRMTLGNSGVAAVKRYGQETKTGHAMVYREGGKHYVMLDQPMADGSMLFDHAREWES